MFVVAVAGDSWVEPSIPIRFDSIRSFSNKKIDVFRSPACFQFQGFVDGLIRDFYLIKRKERRGEEARRWRRRELVGRLEEWSNKRPAFSGEVRSYLSCERMIDFLSRDRPLD